MRLIAFPNPPCRWKAAKLKQPLPLRLIFPSTTRLEMTERIVDDTLLS
jgi:hypothetical protein